LWTISELSLFSTKIEHMFEVEIAVLDIPGVLGFVSDMRTVSEQAETAILTAAARYADLHGDLHDPAAGRSLPGTERLVSLGGDGTPLVAEFAAAEFAVELGLSPFAGAQLIADAVDLRHRLPQLWARVQAGEVKPWIARKTARASRHLDADGAGLVDRRVTPWAHSLSWGRLQSMIDAAVIAADPDAAADAAEAAHEARGVWVGRSSDHGIKDVYIRADAPDVVWFDATIDRIADGLKLLGDTDTHDGRRAAAVGVIAHPQRCLDLFVTAAAIAGPDPELPADHPDHNPDADDPAGADTEAEGGTGAASSGSSRFARRVDSRPAATLYMHLTDQALSGHSVTGHGTGVARLEGVGPITIDQARRFLRHCQVTVKPVLDLAAIAPVDAYEIPDRLRDAVHLRSPADVFPYATNTSRRMDLDHTQPYLDPDSGGPPGQTRLNNLAPMTRFHHRIKTFGRWRVEQPTSGVLIWTTPHDRRYQVDHTGTHRIDEPASSRHPDLRDSADPADAADTVDAADPSAAA
jgi:hypothetical protein